MSQAPGTTRLKRPPNTSLHQNGDATASGTGFLLQRREDPSPGSGVRTGLVLMTLLAIFSVFSVSLYSPGLPGGDLWFALWAALGGAFLVAVLLGRTL